MFWVGPAEQQWPHLMTRWCVLFPNVPVLVLQPSSIEEVISGVFVLQRICSSWHQDQQLQCSWRLATVIGLYACLHLWLRSWWSQWGRMSSCHWQLVTFKYAVFWRFSLSGISWIICLSISSSFPFLNCVCILVGLGAGSSWKFCMALLGDSIHTASLLWYSGRHDVQILVSVCHTTLFLFSLLSSLTLPGFPLILFPLPVPPPAGFGEVFLVWSVKYALLCWELVFHVQIILSLFRFPSLIAWLWWHRFARAGSVVLAIHDASDVFLEIGKLTKYYGLEIVPSIAFVLFALQWLLLRLIYFPFHVIWSTRYAYHECT